MSFNFVWSIYKSLEICSYIQSILRKFCGWERTKYKKVEPQPNLSFLLAKKQNKIKIVSDPLYGKVSTELIACVQPDTTG